MLAHSTNNYLYGKGILYFKASGGDGYHDFGNVPSFGITVGVETSEHYSSRFGTKEKDKKIATEKTATASFTLEEINAENLNIAFLGDGVQAASQEAGTIDAAETTVADDLHISLGKTDLYLTRLSHGTVTDGPFQAGETVTGGTSAATGKVAWVGSGFIEVVSVSGTFQAAETITGGTSTGSAAVSNIETSKDVVVVDAATPTTRYTLGDDYDVDVVGGLLRKRSDGDISGASVYVSADYSLKSNKYIRALANSELRGELLFVGNPDYGQRWRVQGWDVALTVGGDLPLISDDIAQLSMSAEFLSDRTNHPDEPFFRATQAS